MIDRRSCCRVAMVALAALACEKASGPDAQSLGPAPAPVVVVVSTASLSKSIAGVRAYAEAMRPGSAVMLSEQLVTTGLARAVGADSLDGVDLSGPMHMIVVDGPTRSVVVGR